MKLIPYQKFPKSITGSIVSVGNFDGIHKGHDALIREVVKRAKEKGLASVIVTFEPHTRSVVPPGSLQPVISTLDEKAFLIGPYGVDYLVWIPFNEAFAEISPQDFIENVLIKDFRAKEWIMGEQHTFGRERSGNKNFLQLGHGRNHIYVFPVVTLTLQEAVVSSTEIRRKLIEGEVAEAVQMLGHPYLVSAQRVSGIQKGTQLGFPTLNFSRPSVNKVLPPPGVYAALLEYRERKRQGAFYFGNCPTFPNRDFHLEFHEFDFTGEAPGEGETAHLWLYAHIRKDMKFATQEALVTRMKIDSTAIKNFFAGEGICR
jgi:riboflavin kinase/FMN adenylyltransferase